MIWPAIDIMDGRCVRLHQGDFAQQTRYDDDPIMRAKAFAGEGAKALHIVDLDGAKKGMVRQSRLIANIAQSSGLMVQAGGGIRTTSDIQNLLDNGVTRVIIGSKAITEPETVHGWLRRFGAEHIVLALDVRLENDIPVPAIRGWQESVSTTLWDVLATYGQSVRHLLVTDIGRDGVLGGANTNLYRQIKSGFPALSLLGSGGVGALDDIKAVRASGANGVIVGKALYERRFSLQEALACWPGV